MASLQSVLNRFAQLRELYQKVGVRAGARASTILGRLAQEIVNAVGAGTDASGNAVPNQAAIDALSAEIDRAILRTKRDYANAYAEIFKEAGSATLEETPAVYRAFGTSSVRALEAARDDFIQNLRGTIYNAGFNRWISRFPGDSLKSSMQRSLINAQLQGWDQRTLAKDFLRDPQFQFANLPSIGERGERIFSLGGRLAPSDALIRRAHTIARTETTAITQSMHRGWTEEAGMDLAINYNGDPVSEICISATEQDPMTFEEWDKSEWGSPPRHPNCDSILVAVPREFN